METVYHKMNNWSIYFVNSVLGTNKVYVLPSSVHECLILDATYGEPKKLQEIVQEVNESVLAEGDYLSDNVYVYDCVSEQLTIAEDLENAD